MRNVVNFSVIIPQRGSFETLQRLFDSIPANDDVEVILVENNEEPQCKQDIAINRDYALYRSNPARYAGGARNEGMAHAKGKWLIFSDADDFFTEEAFKIFESQIDSDADIIYFSAQGIYPDTGELCSQADLYSNLVKSYIKDRSKEMGLRLSFHVPWAKMVRRSFVEKYHLKYDEVVANNDDFFALTAGFYARKIDAIDKPVYYYVVNKGSLMHRRSKEVMKTRLEVILRCNKFKKEHGLCEYQGSIAYFLSEGLKYGPKAFLEYVCLIVKYRQNPFIGYKNWVKTYKKRKDLEKKEKKYITNN